MSDRLPPEERPTITERLTAFLHRRGTLMWGVLGAVVLFFVVYFAYDAIRSRRLEQSTVRAEEATDFFEQWRTATDDKKRAAALERFQELTSLVLKKYPRLYGAQRALYLQARYHVESKEWEQAASLYEQLARRFPRSYLAPLSLFNAAASLENAGKEKEALARYQRIVSEYPESYLVPHALFSEGRIQESLHDPEAAKQAYSELADNHPSSNWTRMAKNRIIALGLKR